MKKNGRMRMQGIKKLLRLYIQSELSVRQIGNALSISKSTIGDYITRFKDSGLTLEDLESKSESEIYSLLFKEEQKVSKRHRKKVLPDFASIHLELKKKYVTRDLLWCEYKSTYPDNHYGYTHFCNLYKAWRKKLLVTMHINHKAGEKTFMDFSGLKWEIIDTKTGLVTKVDIFVATLGASGYTFAEATFNQTKQQLIGACVHAVEYFGGVTEILVPDNLKSAVTKANKYDPAINETFQDMADHYGSVVIPARPYRAKDKAKVELSVKLVQRWILARLRHRKFFSLYELNREIFDLLDYFNNRIIRRYGKSRYQLYLELDKPALKALPAVAYSCREFKYCKVNIDYHIELEGNYYSVPYQLSGSEVFAMYTATCVEIIYNNKRVALHSRLYQKGAYSTEEEHMASAHRIYAKWSPSRLINWAGAIGNYTQQLITTILKSKPHPEMGFRSSIAILQIAKHHNDVNAIELTSKRMLDFHLHKVSHFKKILKNKTYKQTPENSLLLFPKEHKNIRGNTYYN